MHKKNTQTSSEHKHSEIERFLMLNERIITFSKLKRLRHCHNMFGRRPLTCL